MGSRFPRYFSIALILFVLVLGGALFSLMKRWAYKSNSAEFTDSKTDQVIPADSFYFDLEAQVNGLENLETVKAEASNKAKHSCSMDESTEFSVAFSRPATAILDFNKQNVVTFSFSIFAQSPVKNAQVVYSLSGEDGKDSDWQSKELICDSSTWVKYDFNFVLNDEFRKGSGKVKLYVWNKGKESFLIDDISIIFN